jgi:hypothetical protein
MFKQLVVKLFFVFSVSFVAYCSGALLSSHVVWQKQQCFKDQEDRLMLEVDAKGVPSDFMVWTIISSALGDSDVQIKNNVNKEE